MGHRKRDQSLSIAIIVVIVGMFVGVAIAGGLPARQRATEIPLRQPTTSTDATPATDAALALPTSTAPSVSFPVVVFDGNSLTFGTRASAGETYPDQVLRDRRVKIGDSADLGVPGQTTEAMLADDAEVDALYQPGGVVLVWEGTNDLYFGSTTEESLARLRTYCERRRAAGWRVVVGTVLPRSDPGTPSTFEADRVALNQSIRSEWSTFADALMDFAADERLADNTNARFFSDDLVHLNDNGYRIVAKIAVETLIGLDG